MSEANLPYENGDEAKLRSILVDWESSPDAVEGEGVGAELVRMIRKIAQIQRRIAEIELELQQIKTADLYQVKSKADEAERQGRDLLKEMVSQIEQQIASAKRRLTASTGENSAA